MIRMPLASASLLAIAISLAGCGEDKAPATQAATPAATESAAPATAAKVDEAAAKAVVNHYADLALAVFRDAASTGQALQSAVDAPVSYTHLDVYKRKGRVQQGLHRHPRFRLGLAGAEG